MTKKTTAGLCWHTNAKGEWELRKGCGAVVAQVLFWPHYRGDWLTIKDPEDWRDSGMKRYRTAKGGKTYLIKKLSLPCEIPIDVSA